VFDDVTYLDLNLYLVKQESNGWSEYYHVKKTFRQYEGVGSIDWKVPNVQEDQSVAPSLTSLVAHDPQLTT